MTIRSPDPSVNNTVRQVAYVHDTNVYGGVEVFMLLLIENLDPQRYSPVIVIPGYTDPYRGSPARFIQQVQEIGVPLIRLPVKPEIPGFGLFSQIQKTVRVFKESNFDVVHIHTCRPLGARISTIGAWLSRIPARLRTEHLSPTIFATSTTRFTVKPLDWMTNYILTVSDATLEDQVKLIHRDSRKMYRSYGGIEVDRFNPGSNPREAKRKIGLDPEVPVVGLVGRLSEQKGHTFLINAAPRIVEAYGPVNFLLIGDGPLEQQLKQQVGDLGLCQYFHFTGFKQEVNRYMAAMDIGVMPSLWEAFPLVLLEFMAMGIPTVTSSVPCFREAIVDGESGFIASLEQENSLADRILELLYSPEKTAKIGEAALERVHSHFSAQRLANDMMDLYDRILDPKTDRN